MVDVLAFTSLEFSKSTVFSFERKVPVTVVYLPITPGFSSPGLQKILCFPLSQVSRPNMY
jgi:hypothetical protein